MLNAVNAVMDAHFLTPAGSRPQPLDSDSRRRLEPQGRYLVSGKYRLFPFDKSAKAYFDDAAGRLGVALSDYSFANNVSRCPGEHDQRGARGIHRRQSATGYAAAPG